MCPWLVAHNAGAVHSYEQDILLLLAAQTQKACLLNIAACHSWLQKDHAAAVSLCGAVSLHYPTNVQAHYLKGCPSVSLSLSERITSIY